MLDLKSKLMGIVSIVGGIALIAYALAFLGNPTPFFLFALS